MKTPWLDAIQDDAKAGRDYSCDAGTIRYAAKEIAAVNAECEALRAQLAQARALLHDVAAPWCDTKARTNDPDCGECPPCRAKAFFAAHPETREPRGET